MTTTEGGSRLVYKHFQNFATPCQSDLHHCDLIRAKIATETINMKYFVSLLLSNLEFGVIFAIFPEYLRILGECEQVY